jgi:hypothetical protein
VSRPATLRAARRYRLAGLPLSASGIAVLQVHGRGARSRSQPSPSGTGTFDCGGPLQTHCSRPLMPAGL